MIKKYSNLITFKCTHTQIIKYYCVILILIIDDISEIQNRIEYIKIIERDQMLPKILKLFSSEKELLKMLLWKNKLQMFFLRYLFKFIYKYIMSILKNKN